VRPWSENEKAEDKDERAVRFCPRCQRTNPREAVYCYFDGVVLDQRMAGAVSPSRMLQEFVFPSGRRCKTFDDLVQGCQYEWEDARHLLRNGDFTRYFAQIGRHDLARTAGENQALPDPDIALHTFLNQLPASQIQGPRLDLNPRRLLIGGVRPGEQRPISLTVLNLGKGLLQGKVTVSEGGQWLKIADCGSAAECSLKTAKEQRIQLHVDARGLTAPQTYSGKLTVITNGGISEVAVRLDVSSIPFDQAPFQGAANPRQMAERMRANPKQAVPLLESGEIAHWFQLNGWTYPVSASPARGVAAVQQFFEGMGLSKPPPLQLSEQDLHIFCMQPEVAQARVLLRTPAKKWVYAQADSDKPWLRVTTPSVSGPQQAQIAFEVDSTLMDAGGLHLGNVYLTANAGQRLAVRVQVNCTRPHEPFTRRLLRPFFVGALLALLLRLLLTGPADLYARGWGHMTDAAGTHAPWIYSTGAENHFLKRFILATWWAGIFMGAALVWRRRGHWSDVFCGGLAGAFAGAIAAGTLGCLLLIFDAVPGALLARWTSPQSFADAPATWTLLWIAFVSACWALVGGGTGFLLSSLGQGGLHLLHIAAGPLVWLFRQCGLERIAAFFLIKG
jgi:hypothetical protein